MARRYTSNAYNTRSTEGPTEGYNFDLLESDIGHGLTCPICTLLFRDAVQLQCQHAFCKICLVKWEKTFHDEESSCSICKAVYVKGSAHPVGVLDRLIKDTIKVYCKQKEGGCDWVGMIDDYYKGHEKVCLYITVTCQLGCDLQCIKKEMETHELTCKYRDVGCKYCKSSWIKEIGLEDHLKTCGSFPVKCTNTGCDKSFERSDKELMDKHIRDDCLFQEIKCKLYTVGCRTKFLRGNREDHNKEEMQYHLTLLMQDYTVMKKRVEFSEGKQKILEEIVSNQHEKIVSLTQEVEMLSKSSEAQGIGENDSTSSEIVHLKQNEVVEENQPIPFSCRIFFLNMFDKFYEFGTNFLYISVYLKNNERIQSDMTIRFPPNLDSFNYACGDHNMEVKSDTFSFVTGSRFSQLYLYKPISEVDGNSIFKDGLPAVYIISSKNDVLKPTNCGDGYRKFDMDTEKFVHIQGENKWIFLAIKLQKNS